MSGILLTTLYFISGIYAYSASHHGIAVLRRQVNRNHLLFALLCLLAAALTLARAGAYQAQTAQTLVEMRRWEVFAGSVFLSLFPWFIARLTGFRPRGLLNGLTLFWSLIITVEPDPAPWYPVRRYAGPETFHPSLGRKRSGLAR